MICMYWLIHSFLVSLHILFHKRNLSLNFGGVNSEIVPGYYWLVYWSTYSVLLSKAFNAQNTFYYFASLVFFLKPINLEDLSLLSQQSSLWLCALAILLPFSKKWPLLKPFTTRTISTITSHLILSPFIPAWDSEVSTHLHYFPLPLYCIVFSMGCGFTVLPGLSFNSWSWMKFLLSLFTRWEYKPAPSSLAKFKSAAILQGPWRFVFPYT